AACPNFKTAAGVLNNPLLNAPGGLPTCPHGLLSPGPGYIGPLYPLGLGANTQGIVYACGDQTLTPVTPSCGTGKGSIGGVAYLPYCSPGSIALGPTDIPGGWDGKGAGDVSSLTRTSTGRDTTFANIFLGCNPLWNGNVGTGQGQLTTNIQENYSLVL